MNKEREMEIKAVLETTALAYESGDMLRPDSEVEIDILEDRGDQVLYVSDYSESRGDAEPIAAITLVDDDEYEEVANLVEEVCDKHDWAYCL